MVMQMAYPEDRAWNTADIASERKSRMQAVSYTHLDVYKRQQLYTL